MTLSGPMTILSTIKTRTVALKTEYNLSCEYRHSFQYAAEWYDYGVVVHIPAGVVHRCGPTLPGLRT